MTGLGFLSLPGLADPLPVLNVMSRITSVHVYMPACMATVLAHPATLEIILEIVGQRLVLSVCSTC